MKTILFLLAVATLFTAAFMARSDWWIVPDINRWQANTLGGNYYSPTLTAFILALPVLLLLALVQWSLKKKKTS